MALQLANPNAPVVKDSCRLGESEECQCGTNNPKLKRIRAFMKLGQGHHSHPYASICHVTIRDCSLSTVALRGKAVFKKS